MKILVLVLCLGLAGCVSTEAAVLRAVQTDRNARELKDAIDNLEGVAAFHHAKVINADRYQLEQALVETNGAIAGLSTKEQVAKATALAYIDYYREMDKAAIAYAEESAKIASLAAEGHARTEQFVAISQLADEELRVPSETAKMVFNSTFSTALQIWKQYQITHPPVVPGEEPEEPAEEGDGGGGFVDPGELSSDADQF